MRVSEYVAVRDSDRRFVCTECGHDLGPATGNFKLGCVYEEAPVEDANPRIGDPKRFIDTEFVFRRYYCPGCAVQVASEVTIAGRPPLHDIEIR